MPFKNHIIQTVQSNQTLGLKPNGTELLPMQDLVSRASIIAEATTFLPDSHGHQHADRHKR